MRQAIVNAVNRLAEESGSLDFELMEAYKLISDYQKESKKAIFKMVIELKNGEWTSLYRRKTQRTDSSYSKTIY